VASFSIVEHLDVLKQIGLGFVSRPIAYAVDTLSLKDGEEALDDGIVVAVTGAAHAAVDAMPGKFVTKVVA
jgi:hypothetical protein